MRAMLDSGQIEAAAIADPSGDMLEAARQLAPAAEAATDLDGLLTHDLDGVVIATPSALHAQQALQALEAGIAVFCQKPLGRSAREVEAVVAAANAGDRLLGVDLSYRRTDGMQRIKDLLRNGDLGEVFAADLIFHNAYGPDKPWFYDKALAGGGCVMDLGVHLIDLALWALDYPEVAHVASSLMAGGRPLEADASAVEDYALATLTLAQGTVIRVACSWRLQAGCEAVIGASFYGTSGGAAMHNVDGSFYTFTADRFHGIKRETLAGPENDWGGRAATDWARQLNDNPRFDNDCRHLVEVARVLDQIYGRDG